MQKVLFMADIDEAPKTAEIDTLLTPILGLLEAMETKERVEAINLIREKIHKLSPFQREPVDFVRWVEADSVVANDYNPNTVAPPEMRLLTLSIQEDGYTQPIVAWKRETDYEVVDGFHRNKVGRGVEEIRTRIHGYLPLAVINEGRAEIGDRMASTIRHNRARGKHRVSAMSDIVVELRRRNWSDEKVARELGMDPDEVLRLMQITGLAEVFSNQEFSKSWDLDDDNIEGVVDEDFQLESGEE
jgi:ParB-like chromosome segregation protein Spo0J